MTEATVIRIHETGGPEVLRQEIVTLGPPGPGEALVRQTAIGLNFIDTYHRSGLYPVKLPAVLGSEGAGVVEAVGEGVETVQPGDRVAYLGAGTYASHYKGPAARMVRLPAEVDEATAAAVLLKGLTAWMLLFEVRPGRAGETALVWAPVGGVGTLLVPWATSLGMRVLAVTSSADKAARARALGAEDTVLRDEDVAAAARAFSGGAGVHVAYDSVGRTSADASLAALRPRGWFVSYGNASGPADPISPGRLSAGGSLVMTRPGLFHFIADHADLARGAAALFGALRVGTLKPEIGQRFALSEVAEAHRAIESGRTVGATVLTP
jgi:NADPH:quinone reductase